MTTNDNTLIGKRDPADQHHHKSGRFWIVVLLIVLVALAVTGILIRVGKHAALAERTKDGAIPSVSVVKATLGPMADDLHLPGTLQAYVDAPLYARTDGYLKEWYFDIGARVKKGQLMAVIETPELDQQLDQARAAVATAKANYDLAIVTNKRYQNLVKTDAVSKQEADQSASTEAAQKANVDAAIANVKHYEALQSFEKIYAPFDGVVTERNTDVGQLVASGIGSSAGSGGNTNGRELFRVSSLDRLRTFIPVPQNQSPYISAGMKADLRLIERPGKSFPAVVARTSGLIDNTSRTLLTEVDIDNKSGELLPGAYVDVHLTVPSDNLAGAVRVPSNVMIFRSHNMQIAVVGADNKIKLHDVTIGRDFGNTIEIVSGIGPDDQLVLNPSDSITDGQAVKIAPEPQGKATAAQSSGDKKSDDSDKGKKGNNNPQKNDVQPSRGSPEPVEKASRKPNPPQGKKENEGIDTSNSDAGRADANGSRVKTDQQKSGDITEGGMTAPGTDGNGAK